MSEAVLSGVAGRPAGQAPRPAPWLVALPALVVLVTAVALMLRRVEPFVNFFYMLARPRFALSLLGWSAVLWFFFELVNFRVANWYYVNLPPERAIRWLGTAVSFATVLPAIFLAERLLAARGSFDGIRWRGFRVTDRTRVLVFLVGVAFAAMSLAWPRIFFPMIWGALTLMLEAFNYRRDPRRSLLGDLSNGRPGRMLRYLAGGLAIGFVWEMYNIESRSKWIYTVPGFENLKLFEMPLAGFLGFPVFALDCFVVYQTLVLLRIAVDPESGRSPSVFRLRPARTALAAALAAVFSLAVLFGMDRWNTDSLRPRLHDLWVAESADRERLAATPYRNLFVLAEAEPGAVAAATGATGAQAREWIAVARLATLRGIGIENARLLWEAGVRSLGELANAEPHDLGVRLRAKAERPRAATPPKVRVWVNAARRATGGRPGVLSLPAMR